MSQRRLPPDERRRQIVEAARSVIVREGLGTTSLRNIANEARVSMGTVTYHFSSIDDIIGAVVVTESERFYTDVVASADAEPDVRSALQLLVDPLFGDTDDVDAHWRIWSDYWAAIGRRPEMTQAYAGRIRLWENCCARVIARGVATGVFRSVDPRESALKLAAYADGLGTQRLQEARDLSAEIARNYLTEFIDLLLSPR
ncbi:MAG: TetR family transcriptional regulator C-terminal domain-containing protein [Microlunatus sp.]